MATSLFKFRDRSFWIHNAVAEVWLSLVKKKIESIPDAPDELIGLAREIEEALRHRWVDGVVSSFNEYANNKDDLEFLKNIMTSVNRDILRNFADHQVIDIGEFAASRDFVVPEIDMIRRMFADDEEFPDRPYLFSVERGWHPA